jgi:hypothetical protein
MKKKIFLLVFVTWFSGNAISQYSKEWFSMYYKAGPLLQPRAVKLMATTDHIYLLATI